MSNLALITAGAVALFALGLVCIAWAALDGARMMTEHHSKRNGEKR